MAGPDRRPAGPALLRLRRPGRASQPRVRQVPRRVRGIALILVLWVLTLLTVMAVGMTAAQRTETALADNRIAEARFRATADAAIAYAIFSFLSPPQETGRLGASGGLGLGMDQAAQTAWVPDGAPQPWEFDGESLSIAVYNEQSRINLNRAPATLLAALMVALGVGEPDATALADAVLDFRDEDDLKLLHGAEDKDYEDSGLAARAKDAPFVAVEELQQVLGMTPELYRLLAPELTVDTDSDEVDEAFASPAVLAAIQGISLEEAQLKVQERNEPALPGSQGPRTVDRGGPLYRVQVRLPASMDHARIMEALVELTEGQQPPYQVRWRRYGLAGATPTVRIGEGVGTEGR
jgi:general secretion pathway protein K